MTENMDNESPAAFHGAVSGCRTMADGTLRVSIDIEPGNSKSAFSAFGSPGDPVAVARLSYESSQEAIQPKPVKGEFGQYAKDLMASGFFRSPDVWAAIGTDDEYLAWVRTQPSALDGQYSEHLDTGEKYCVAAHVRHVEHGSGTGIKPPYSAIPLTYLQHDAAHKHGDSCIGPREWWDRQRIQHVERWARETLKSKLNYDSWTLVPPEELFHWAGQLGIDHYLPRSIVRSTEYGETQEG